MRPFRLAIAGAGAVVERCHLPAARVCPGIRVVALADKDVRRAAALAARFGIPKVTADYRELHDGADGVLVALPNALHAPAAIDFLRQGVPVLVEKPMALNVAEAEEMLRCARETNAVLAVGLVVRHAAGARWIKQAATEELLGPLRRLDLEYGAAGSWRPASSALFSKEQAGGGVLVDLGSHALDLAVWWLGRPRLLECRDDAMGGLEAECTVLLSFAGPTAPVTGTIALSRLRSLANTVRIEGERGAVEWDLVSDTVRVRPSAGRRGEGRPGPPCTRRRSTTEMFADQLRAFAGAATGSGEPTADGECALPVVELIERCYRERRAMECPWTRPALSV
jgi:predicted dehydrogenase